MLPIGRQAGRQATHGTLADRLLTRAFEWVADVNKKVDCDARSAVDRKTATMLYANRDRSMSTREVVASE